MYSKMFCLNNWDAFHNPAEKDCSPGHRCGGDCEIFLESGEVLLIMTGSPTRAIHVRQKPCTHGLADADIVSAFPLSISTFQENINTLRQTSRHDIPSTVGVLCFGSMQKN